MKDLTKHKRIIDKKEIKRCKETKTCQVCGKFEELDPHHIITRGAGGPDHKYNLIALCRKCHRKAHDGYISREKLFGRLSNIYNTPIDEYTVYAIMNSPVC